MSVAARFRALARYNVLTPIAVLAALAASPAMAGTITVIAPDTDGVELDATDNVLVNNSDISNSAGATAVWSSAPVQSITNNGSIVGDEASGIGLDEHIETFTNNGKVEGQGFNAIWMAKGATKFVNAKGGTIINTDASFVPNGNYGGSAVGFDTSIADGGAVQTFVNDGTITAASNQHPDHLQSTVGFFGNNDPTLNYQVGTFTNTGTITGPGAGVSFDGGVGSFSNTGGITSTSQDAINIRGAARSLTNAGTISGAGYSAVSVQKGIDSFVNSGTITNTDATKVNPGDYGGGALGFNTDTDVGGEVKSFVNTGTISAAGNQTTGHLQTTVGFYTDINNGGSGTAIKVGSFSNSGSINGAGRGVGFDGGVGSFANSGTISSTGGEGVGFGGLVDLFSNTKSIFGFETGVNFDRGVTSFINSGTITSTNDNGVRIKDANGVTVTNSGTISGVTGIAFNGSSTNITVINSGTIKGTGGDAIGFWTGEDDTLKILTGSQLLGRVEFGGGADTFDFSGFRGTTVVEVRGLESTVAGSNTFVSALDNNGDGAIGIFDQSGATTVGGTVTTEVVGAIQGAVGGALDGIGTFAPATQPSAYVAPARLGGAAGAAEQAVLSELDTTRLNGTEVWGQVFGGGSRDDAPVALAHVYGGIVAGTHTQLNSNTRLGGLLGVVGSNYDVGGTQKINTQLGVLGVYGEADLGSVVIDYALIGGGAGHTSSRDVVVLGTLETLRANFSSWFVSPSLGVTLPLLSDDGTTVNVAASASYAFGGVSGYTETGNTLSIAVGSVPIGVFDGRLELNGTKLVGATEHGDITLRGKVGVLVQANVGGSNVPVTFSGGALSATSSFTTAGNTSFGGYAGAGLSADIAHNLKLDVSGDALLRNDGLAAIGGKVGLTGSF